MDIVDQIRAKQLGEALLAEFAQYPRDRWLTVTLTMKRKADGGILIDNIRSAEVNTTKEGG